MAFRSNRSARWLVDQLKSLALGLLLGSAAAVILYALIARFPFGWWLPAAAVFALLIVGLANVAPLLLLPLFYSVKPLGREALRARLVALGERAGARVIDAYEWGLGEKTSKANAALTGIGGSRRILVSDTMLAEYSDDEIEVVLAHELAHHVHGDLWKGLAFETVLILAGFFAASWLLRFAAPIAGLGSTADVAGLPLLLLAAGAVSLVTLPAAHAMSRAHERSADRFALTLTGNRGGVHLGDAAPRGAESRGRGAVGSRPMAVLQPPADSRADCGRADLPSQRLRVVGSLKPRSLPPPVQKRKGLAIARQPFSNLRCRPFGTPMPSPRRPLR